MKLARVDLLYLLGQNAKNLYSAVLCGNQNPHQKAVWDACKDAVVGDFAVESTAWFRPARAYAQGDKKNALIWLEQSMGRIARITQEPFPDSDTGATEQVVYLDALCGREIRWTNCSFIKIFEGSTFDIGSERQDTLKGQKTGG